jgi:Glycosyl hydrolase family 59
MNTLTRRGIASTAMVLLCGVLGGFQPKETVVRIDGKGSGRTFEGLGALSAGASTRLLVDYPEPYRSQILDYLFKPNYGAALQHLKVEIGGDTNSTDGSEPSHMHTRDDLNFQRGYEWWLMKEAKKRNPAIILDSLAWGAPGWIGGGEYYSKDMADYVVKFIQGAKKVHGLDITFTGIWNEKPYDREWIKLLRRTLDAGGLSSTKIVAADLYQPKEQWEIINQFATDPELSAAVYAVGVHYPRQNGKTNTPRFAIDSGRTLWSSEDQPALGDNGGLPLIGRREWVPGGKSLAQIYNRNYIEGRMTKTEIWSPITSYYDNLPAPNSGLMYANTPWSGNYNVQSTIWVTAHTTQFTKPGWKYIDSACGYLPAGGTYVTLHSPSSSDYTAVVETIGAGTPQQVRFELAGGVATGAVHVWRSNGSSMFERLADITPRDGAMVMTFDPDAIYTVSTTTGQGKGRAEPPASKPFPFPYRDDFEKTAAGGTPKYLADQDGTFEVTPCTGRTGRCLTQVVTTKPISWGILPKPFTYLGDQGWTDYTVGTDALLDGDGEAAVLGRIDSVDFFQDGKAPWPTGYVLSVRGNGTWELLSTKLKNEPTRLASGTLSVMPHSWHSLALTFQGPAITAAVDGHTIAQTSDSTHGKGMAGIGSGWNRTMFDNFEVTSPASGAQRVR